MVISGTDWLEVPIPYIFGLFLRPKFQGISPQNMAKNMVRLRTSINWILEISHFTKDAQKHGYNDEELWCFCDSFCDNSLVSH